MATYEEHLRRSRYINRARQTKFENRLRKGERKNMAKIEARKYNVYQNPVSKKFYTFLDPEREGDRPEIITVFVPESVYRALQPRVDKSGKQFKVIYLEPAKTKNGYDVLQYVEKTF